MLVLGALALHSVEYQYHSILVLRLNANIFVWMFRYSEHVLDTELECQMLFGWSKLGIEWRHVGRPSEIRMAARREGGA